MSKGRALLLDGLDALREEMDTRAALYPGWQLRASGAPEPHPESAVLIEAANVDIGKVLAIVLLEEMVTDAAFRAVGLDTLCKSMKQQEELNDR